VTTNATNGQRGVVSIDLESTMHVRIDLHYPVAAGNVSLLEMCLEEGIDAFQTPIKLASYLMIATEAAYEPHYPLIEIARRDARKMVQSLLEHGALGRDHGLWRAFLEASEAQESIAQDTFVLSCSSSAKPCLLRTCSPAVRPRCRHFPEYARFHWASERLSYRA
jgi:hypothetical protein